jgi:hypothetical protein
MKSFSAEEHKIHLVSAAAETFLVRQLDPRDIVRETLTVVRECDGALAGIDLKKDHLLVELVASLVVVRLRRAGSR